jgi:N-methylhydantoinase A
MLWVGVDVGGTFTDGVVWDDEAQRLSYAKAPSTPGNPTKGVLDVVELLGADMGRVERFVHGVTIGTNAILEGKGAQVWMLVTRGFRDVLEIARTNRPVLYDIRTQKTPPLVPRTRTIEIEERLLFDGTVETPLDEAQLAAAADTVPDGTDIAVAVCFLHSYANAMHERTAKAAIEAARPGRYVCSSAEVLPQFREYERFNTTVLNAYIGPLMGRYLDTLQSSLAARGYANDVFIMTSNGGVSTADRSKQLPVATVLSGPAGGVAAAVHLGALREVPNLITCDMGGTSTDVCLIEGLRIPVTNEQKIGGHANRTPQIEINAVGAGGGSIAWIDAGDILKVGPQSAGAAPGPACYGKGGTEPTVTDANLVLNRLSAGTPLAGGRITLDRDLAVESIGTLGRRLGLDAPRTADGILRIAVARMVSAIKQISIADGHDPRDFTLLPYGGAGPMHAADIADELEMRRVLVPVGPGNFAAFGSLISDLRRDYVLTRTLQLRVAVWSEVDRVFRDIETQARSDLLGEGVPAERIAMIRSAGMRYLGQSWELNVGIAASVASIEELIAAFSSVHDRRFGHRSGGAVEIVNFRVTGVGRVHKPTVPRWAVDGAVDDARTDVRPVYFDGAYRDTSVYARHRLPAGQGVEGPALVEESGSTTVIPSAWHARVLEHGEILLERR